MTSQRWLIGIGIAIPVLVALFIVAVIVLPRLFTKPTVNFVYATGIKGYGYEADGTPYRDLPEPPGATVSTREYYVIRDGRLARDVQQIAIAERRQRFVPAVSDRTEVRFYVHDVRANTSRAISFEEAAALRLDDSEESPDGFRLQYTYGGGGGGVVFPFIFFGSGRGESSWELTGRGVRHAMNLRDPSARRYERGIIFLGWVVSS